MEQADDQEPMETISYVGAVTQILFASAQLALAHKFALGQPASVPMGR